MPNRPDLPSLTALQAFEAALRHQSFSRAAAELFRTQGAISRQIAGLERQLGQPLFHREHPRVRPTHAAERFGVQVRAIISRLTAATFEMQTAQSTGGVLHLAILPTFGTRWLIPRIPDFYAERNDVALELSTRLGIFDFDVELLDAAIHYGEGAWPGAGIERLMDEEVVLVCSSKFKAEHRLTTPEDVLGLPLLQLETRPHAWKEWFQSVGISGRSTQGGARFEHHLMVIQAAIAGLGVALLPTFLVTDEIADGRLIEPLEGRRTTTSNAYWLAYPERSRRLPALRAFRDWLKASLADEGLLNG